MKKRFIGHLSQDFFFFGPLTQTTSCSQKHIQMKVHSKCPDHGMIFTLTSSRGKVSSCPLYLLLLTSHMLTETQLQQKKSRPFSMHPSNETHTNGSSCPQNGARANKHTALEVMEEVCAGKEGNGNTPLDLNRTLPGKKELWQDTVAQDLSYSTLNMGFKAEQCNLTSVQ